MSPLQNLYIDALFRLSSMTWLNVLDILLVTVAFYLLLSLVQRSRAAFLLRGALVLGLVFFIVTILLPLPTFDWLVRLALIAMGIATPIIFQPELRRLLERIGRTTGLARAIRQTEAEHVMSELMRAVEKLSSTRTGALIVLEGDDSLQDFVETGVPMGGPVASEVIEAIFYPGNPLHDGAAILRPERIVAAGCVLPLTERPLDFPRRLGTRHRAAVGLSETCDALVVVVSEETCEVSVARAGHLQRPVENPELREQLYDFFVPSPTTIPKFTGRSLITQIGRYFWPLFSLPSPRHFLTDLGLFLVSALLALVAWTFVTEQINPAKRVLVEDIPLRVDNVPAGTTLMTSPPATVSAIIQGTNSVLETLSTDSYQANVSLEGAPPGLQHLPVVVNTGATQVRVLSVSPPALDLELAPIITRTVTVSIDLPDRQNLSPAYEVVGTPTASPAEVQVVGAAPLVERVSRVQATITLANASVSLREIRPLRALDEQGREVTGVTLQPAQVQVSVPIRRRLNALDVGVRAVISNTPPAGYWLSGLSVTPTSVTLQGNQEQLAQIGSFVDTLPVDVSQAVGDLTLEIPLNLPPGVQAVDGNGNEVRMVTVLARIAARRGDLTMTRPVELIGTREGNSVTVNPRRVDLLLSGPLPVLNQIEADPNLIRVLVDITDLTPGQDASLTPTIIAPEGIRAQLVPPSVLVTLAR